MALLYWDTRTDAPRIALDGEAWNGRPILRGDPGKLNGLRMDIEDGILDVPDHVKEDDDR